MAWCPLGTQSLPETMYCLRHQMLSLGCNHLTTVATTDPWASLHCPKPTVTYFFKTSLWSLDHLLCVACSPQSPITYPIYWIWKSILRSCAVLTTTNGSKSNAHPILTRSNFQSPMLTQFSPVQIVKVQCSPNSHQFKLLKSNAHPILITSDGSKYNPHSILTNSKYSSPTLTQFSPPTIVRCAILSQFSPDQKIP